MEVPVPYGILNKLIFRYVFYSKSILYHQQIFKIHIPNQ